MDAKITAMFISLLAQLTTIIIAVAAFFVAWGGVLYATAAGSVHQQESGKRCIIGALTGIAIVLMARVIADTVGGALK